MKSLGHLKSGHGKLLLRFVWLYFWINFWEVGGGGRLPHPTSQKLIDLLKQTHKIAKAKEPDFPGSGSHLRCEETGVFHPFLHSREQPFARINLVQFLSFIQDIPQKQIAHFSR
jgi:hypothetical protein